MAEVLLYPSFGAPLVFLWSPYGEPEVSLRCDGDPAEVYALGNMGGVANEADFNGLRTYVHGRTDLCSFSGATNRLLELPDNSNINGKTRMKYNFIMFK